ncbi:aminotransferase class I/II-fold pyridoxal phosphate-dependent enzyme [Sphingobacterium sp. SGG-5]|uniref:aminotransferase class I/II-fold pyridoxal phosphate-dependent enzyme n=1 Tax=Sphingobacterium sp. SGG-5 TaxID=2710881 RepID=UPI0013EA4317|nr:aminotransferase class I/II-fold pyridoxal phosphate-dependent enzyme [Sphingobacterium sp. SGG-5]NGM60897.1 aminotransferase class I/II-fold pyridoxal phosphate-dependent enzyme [Sphingobacterium sp. SGG-5]
MTTSFRQLHQPTGRLLDSNKQHFLFFGGTAYLGLTTDKEYTRLYKEGIDRYGLNNGTSRSNNVQQGIYGEVEDYLASRFGFTAAAIFSSGYLAAQAAVQALSADQHAFFAPNCHPALWPSLHQPYVHESFEQWITDTVQEINESEKRNFVLVSNSLDNLTPEMYNFSILKNIRKDKNVTLILDDSHGIGVLYRNAIGTQPNLLELDNIELVVVASLAKGMGTDAGVVLGSAETVQRIQMNPIFRGGSPPSPAGMHALRHGQAVYEKQFDRLHESIHRFHELLPAEMLRSIPDFPVFTSSDSLLYARLMAQNMVISSFPYPLATSPLLNRIVLSAVHEIDDLKKLAHYLQG